jgi:hypothetical protein
MASTLSQSLGMVLVSGMYEHDWALAAKRQPGVCIFSEKTLSVVSVFPR